MPEEKINHIRLLLVDDEEDLVTFLSQRLLKRGFTVTASTNGPDAIAACQNQKFDIAIVDLKMPGMDGITVIKQLKEHLPFVEAIILTGHGSTDSALAAGKLDAFRYLIKPYEFEQLLELINEAFVQKKDIMQKSFQKEFDTLINSNASPHDIMVKGDELRRLYEQD